MKDRENTEVEDRLFRALHKLYLLFEDDAGYHDGALSYYLKDHKVPQYSYVARYLLENKIVDQVKKGKTKQTFWNLGSMPTPQKVQYWIEKARDYANSKKRPHTGSTLEEIGDSFKKTAEALSTDGIVVDEKSIGEPYEKSKLKVEQLDTEITRLRKELRIAHEETEMHKKQCLDALDKNNELQSLIKDQAEQIIIFQDGNHKLSNELHDAREESFKEFDLGIGKDLKIKKLKKVIKQLTKVL